MIIDVKKMRTAGQYVKEFSFEYHAPPELITFTGAEFDGAFLISGSAYDYDDCVYIAADVKGKLKGQCTGCLSPAYYDFSLRLEEEFFEGKTDSGYTYSFGRIDLSQAINDLIMLEMPYKMLCGIECNGLCAGCGANLNTENCKCDNQ